MRCGCGVLAWQHTFIGSVSVTVSLFFWGGGGGIYVVHVVIGVADF